MIVCTLNEVKLDFTCFECKVKLFLAAALIRQAYLGLPNLINSRISNYYNRVRVEATLKFSI